MTNKTIRILTRDSFLALAQTIQVSDYLIRGGYDVEVKALKTSGDIKLDSPLYKVTQNSGEISKEGKAYFTKELEDGLLRNDGDIAVHSLKDLPTELPEGLAFATPIMPVECSDSIICKEPLPENPEDQKKYFKGKVIGSSSLRRIALVNKWFPEVDLVSVRGNVVTRLEKLLNNDGPHALILATAGLKRLFAFYEYWSKNRDLWEKKLESSITERLDKDFTRLKNIFSKKLFFYEMDPEIFLPAVSQGVLGIESRDAEALHFSQVFKSANTEYLSKRIALERSLLSRLEAGCHIPYGNLVKTQEIHKKSFFSISTFFARNYSPEEGRNVDAFESTRMLPLTYTEKQCDILVNEIKGHRFKAVLCGLESESFIEILDQAGFQAFHIPLIESIPVEKEFNLRKTYSCAVVASKNCVDHFPVDLPKIAQWIAVGNKTGEYLKQKKNISNVLVPEKNDGQSAASLALNIAPDNPSFLWFGALNGKKDGIELLKKAGHHVDVYEGYQTQFLDFKLPDEETDRETFLNQTMWWVFTSPTSVKSYIQQKLFRPEHLIAVIGETTAGEFLKNDIIPYMISSKSDLKIMAEEIVGTKKNIQWKLIPWNLY